MTKSQDPLDSKSDDEAVIRSISEERFSTYLRLYDSRAEALEAYWWNVRASGVISEVLDTLEERHVTWSYDAEPYTARYPSLDGALYIKATNWMEIIPPPESDDVKREKHLIDAIALANAATLTELQADSTKGFVSVSGSSNASHQADSHNADSLHR